MSQISFEIGRILMVKLAQDNPPRQLAMATPQSRKPRQKQPAAQRAKPAKRPAAQQAKPIRGTRKLKQTRAPSRVVTPDELLKTRRPVAQQIKPKVQRKSKLDTLEERYRQIEADRAKIRQSRSQRRVKGTGVRPL